MNIEQLVKNAKMTEPSLGALSDDAARSLLQAAFQRICDEINSTNEGVVRVAMLGRFHVRQAEAEKDGRRAQVKRISFRPAAD